MTLSASLWVAYFVLLYSFSGGKVICATGVQSVIKAVLGALKSIVDAAVVGGGDGVSSSVTIVRVVTGEYTYWCDVLTDAVQLTNTTAISIARMVRINRNLLRSLYISDKRR